uniref:(northern house mosquito) hypothetical protein n=1 Tax=Culex pipiens TaxID=7175 RepID=A0A8D8F672_CULPI
MSTVWGKCCNDEIEIQSYDEQYQEATLDVLRKSFFLNEKVCIGAEVNLDRQAQADLEKLCVVVCRGSGVSLVARQVATGEIVGVSFNVLQTPSEPNSPSFFESFRDNHCFSESSRSTMQYNITMDAKVDLFQRFGIDCLFEIMFLATQVGFEGKGIASALVACSVKLAKKLKSLNDLTSRRPKLVSSLFTSRYSQSVGRKNNFKELLEVPHAEFVFRGKTYADRIGPDHPSSIIMVREI